MWSSFLFISCLLAALWGAGFCVMRVFPPAFLRRYCQSRGSLMLAVPLSAGLLLNYTLSFFFRFSVLLWVLVCLSAVGWALAATDFREFPLGVWRKRLLFVPAFLLVFFVSHVKNIGSPIDSWDGRSIHFFHAKIIASNDGRIFGIKDFADPSVAFSHPDYPNLVPALAGQIAAAAGYWNEFLPKAALSVMLFIALLYLAALSDSPGMFLWLALVSRLALAGHLTNGNMDGCLALFCFILAGSLAAFFTAAEEDYTANSAVCALLTGIVLSIKNDGYVWLAAVIPVFLFLVLRRGKGFFTVWLRGISGSAGRVARLSVFGAFAVSGFLCWKYYCRVHALANDYLSSPLVSNGLHRLASDPLALRHIFRYALVETNIIYMAAAFAAGWLVLRARGREMSSRTGFLALAAGVSAGLLCVVYITTPYDMLWQLETSASRTILPVKLALACALYFLAAENRVRIPVKPR